MKDQDDVRREKIKAQRDVEKYMNRTLPNDIETAGHCTIHTSAVIYPGVKIGRNVYIGPGCIIGAPPESLHTWPKPGVGVVIEDGARLTGNVTVDSGIERPTTIRRNAFLMKGVHVGHDCIIGDRCVLAAHVCLAGYVEMGSDCKVGIGTLIRNRKVIPENVEFGMGSVVLRSSELWANGVFVGDPVSFLRWKDESV